jgi:hypothetical protein
MESDLILAGLEFDSHDYLSRRGKFDGITDQVDDDLA